MTDRVLMKGNEAIAEAAVAAGCDAYFGYPITPQAEILEWMARRMPELGRVFIQAESELGAINMAALEEMQTSQERKSFLDSQDEDLSQALETLENAIRKIDRETRELLQSTFDTVNEHFSQKFPALFGGGEAKLDGPERATTFEPDAESIFAELLPRYATAKLYASMAEALAPEHSARMVAMGSARKKAG